jgi:hypothetical protein
MTSDLGISRSGGPTPRRMRLPTDGPAQVTVVSVYPSAWHLRWSTPCHLCDRVRTGGVSALAVDVEPEVFRNGDDRDFTSQLAAWREQTGFIQGDDLGANGTLAAK